MMQPQPMIVVRDVEAASRWFQSVLGLRSAHGGPDYEMLVEGETLVLQLHRPEADEHPHLMDPSDPSRGNGVALWFRTDDFDALIGRVEAASATVLEGPHYNPLGRQQEVWLEGPDGYCLVVAGPRG